MLLRSIVASLIVVLLATMAGAQMKISGMAQCGKPDPVYTLQVGDRPNHSFELSQAKCPWTTGFEIAGIQAKEEVDVTFSEISGNTSRDRGYGVGAMANGDKYYARWQGTATLKEGVPQSVEGKWSFTGGIGKLKGIKGQGTYKGKANAEGGITFEVEGEYTLPK